MVNKNKWIYNYNCLTLDSQLEVAEAIVNVLKDNEMVYDEIEYDKEKSKKIRELLYLIMHKEKQLEELKIIEDVLKKIESLSSNNRRNIINEVLEIIVKYLGIQEQENQEQICQQEGHIFGKWKHNKWIQYIDTIIDHQHIHNYPVEHENWERTCSRCGFVEKVDHKPQKLVDIRIEKRKKHELKK